jgi:hypothetical protein
VLPAELALPRVLAQDGFASPQQCRNPTKMQLNLIYRVLR